MKRLPSIRLLLTLIAVVPALAASVILVAVATVTGRRVAEQLASQRMESAASRASGDVRSYLAQAVRVSELYTRRLRAGQLATADFERSWLGMMADDLSANPEVASICFGNPRGQATWLSRAHNRLEFGLASGAGGERDTIELETKPSGAIASTQPLRVYHYDPRQRPWYSIATSSPTPTWTPIYFWFADRGAESETGTGYASALKSADGSLAGVLIIDVTLSAMSEFLRRLPLAETGYAFIVDEKNLLVAASKGNVNSASAERLPIGQSDQHAAQAAAGLLASSEPSGRVEIDGAPARVRITTLNPYPGINWKMIAILPESAFLGHVRSMQQRAATIGAVAVIGALGLGLLLSRYLAQPLTKLAAHVGKVGAGDFDARLDLDRARELRDVSQEINKMSAGLKHSMELQQSLKLAAHVQQSLLPDHPPSSQWVEVSGHSMYCDSTGGDYLDFIDVADLPGKQTLVAVGDVTGHGIGAALLMATARGSVRASISAGASTADVMSRVNHVISGDTRHELFMTLSLLVLDGETRSARYASAGHDAPILYDPATDTFEELEGGDLPLGVMDGIEFEEYRRENMPAGAFLVIGTDGIWEARDPKDELYGKERLRELIRDHRNSSAEEMARAIDEALAKFVAPNRPQDDVTFVILKFQAAST